jgi:SAM-dependent methyltransferase
LTWWHLRRLRASFVSQRSYWSMQIDFPDIGAVLDADCPRIEPYGALAEIYEDYLPGYQYGPFLRHLSHLYEVPLSSILDVGCGSGKRTVELTAIAPRVVGVDVSVAMIAKARAKNHNGCSYVEGDLRNFALDEKFNVIVSSMDALNYLQEIGELSRAFENVSRHLKPGGLFVFDALTEFGLKAYSNSKMYLHISVNGKRCLMRFRYDPENRVEETFVGFPQGVERHRQIPIEAADVEVAARDVGLKLLKQWRFDPYQSRFGYVLHGNAELKLGRAC